MPPFRYIHQGVEVVRYASDDPEAITRAGQVIRDHRDQVLVVDVDGRFAVGLGQDLIDPDEVVAVPTAWTRHRERGPAQAHFPPPAPVGLVGYTVADLRRRLGGLDARAELRLASRYPTPSRPPSTLRTRSWRPTTGSSTCAEAGSWATCPARSPTRWAGDLAGHYSERSQRW